MGEQRTLKLGLVGCGFMGQFAHLRNYLAIPQCRVVALAELRPRLRQEVARRYGIERTYASHRELLEDPEVEAVAAILPAHLTGPVGIEVLAAGRHLATEKPMASSAEEAEEMVRLADQKGLHHQVGFMKAYDAGVEEGMRVIAQWRRTGEFGDLTFARAHCFCGDWTHGFGHDVVRTDEPAPSPGLEPRPPAWMTEDEVGEFNAFTNVFSHNLNLVRLLFGPDPRLVAAHRSGGGCYVVVLDVDGVAVTLELGQMTRNRWDEEAKAYFRHGWVEILTPSPLEVNVPAAVNVYRAKGEHTVTHHMPPWSWAFRRAAAAFVRSVLRDEEPRTSGRFCLGGVRLAEEIFRRLREP
ncbi:MAG: Gfo/Idh/MocA family protein [Candidatus Brocadiia bacterium]